MHLIPSFLQRAQPSGSLVHANLREPRNRVSFLIRVKKSYEWFVFGKDIRHSSQALCFGCEPWSDVVVAFEAVADLLVDELMFFGSRLSYDR